MEVKAEDLTPHQHVEKRKKKRGDKRKTNSNESSSTNPFKAEPCEEEQQEEQQELSGPENVNQKPRVVVPSPTGMSPCRPFSNALKID